MGVDVWDKGQTARVESQRDGRLFVVIQMEAEEESRASILTAKSGSQAFAAPWLLIRTTCLQSGFVPFVRFHTTT